MESSDPTKPKHLIGIGAGSGLRCIYNEGKRASVNVSSAPMSSVADKIKIIRRRDMVWGRPTALDRAADRGESGFLRTAWILPYI